MAIIIPSKNIYESNNPKIRDNTLNSVTVKHTVISPHNEYDVSVHNEIFDAKELSCVQEYDDLYRLSIVSSVDFTSDALTTSKVAVSYAKYTSKYREAKFKIPVLADTYYVDKVQFRKDENGNYNFNFSYQGTIEKGTTTGQVTLSGTTLQDVEKFTITHKDKISSEKTEFNYKSIFPITNPVSNDYGEIADVDVAPTIILSIPTNTEVTTSKEDGIEYYNIKLSILSEFSIFKSTAKGDYNLWHYDDSKNTQTIAAEEGSYEIYIPDIIKATVNGNKIGISLADGTVTYENGNNPYTLEGNELIQNSAKVSNKSLTQHLADNILSQYNKGKETAVLLCSVSDYYDEQERLVITSKNRQVNYPITVTYEKGIINSTININTENNATYPIDLNIKIVYVGATGTYDTEVVLKKETTTVSKTLFATRIESIESVAVFADFSMSFNFHDKVIPMVNDINGEDKPISYYEDGSPKVFDVVGINFIYDGAVWQEITIQEVSQSNI